MNLADLEITRHAAIQWATRTIETDPGTLRRTWDAEIATAKEIALDPVGTVLALTAHDFEDARYFRSHNGWVFVVSGGKIVTVHSGTAKRFLKAKIV